MDSTEKDKCSLRRYGPKRKPEKILTKSEKLEWAFRWLGLACPLKADRENPGK